MLSDILKDEAGRLLDGLEPEPLRRDDLRRNKHKRLQLKDGMAFECGCGQQFDADWSLIVSETDPETDQPETVHYALCPACGEQAAPAKWYSGILKSWRRSLADKDLNERRGKFLEGTRTPEQNAVARFNGYMHGAYSRSKHLFPNAPGSKWCVGCEIDADYCRANPAGACVKAAEAYMLRHISLESGDPTVLNRLIAVNQANADVLFSMMTHDLLASGVKYSKPEYVNSESGPQIVRDDNGEPIRIDYVNPVLPYWQKQLAVMNQTPADTNTTHRHIVKDDDGGSLMHRADGEKEALESVLRSQAGALDNLAALIAASQLEDKIQDK